MMNTDKISKKTIERLSIYRRILSGITDKDKEYLYSYELAALAQSKPTQVRRDVMSLKSMVRSQKGYNVSELLASINEVLDDKDTQKMALVGTGNIGRAFIKYFQERGNNLTIAAAFDTAPDKVNQSIDGCKCYHIDELKNVINKENITICIIAVPEKKAQSTAKLIVEAGVRAIINIATIPINVPNNVFVENLDFTTSFEKTAYYARIYSQE